MQKLNQDLFTELQRIIYLQDESNNKPFKIQKVNLRTTQVEYLPNIIKENIKWLISLNSFNIRNEERIQILNFPLDKQTSNQLTKNKQEEDVVIIPLIKAKKNDLAMEMLLFDSFLKDEKPLVEIEVTYNNVIEKKFTVKIDLKAWSEIENKVNNLLNKIKKQEKLEEIINFSEFKVDWQESKLLLKLAEYIKNKVDIDQIKNYYFPLKGEKVQFTLDYSKHSQISKFNLSSYTSKMFDELWIPSFNDKNEFEGWDQLFENETNEEKIKTVITWIIKLKLLKAVFAINQEDVSTRFSNKFGLEKAQQFFISDLFFQNVIKIEITSLEQNNQFNVKINKTAWSNISTNLEDELNSFKNDSTISNEEYKNLIVNNVTIDKIKAYYDYILDDLHQFIVDFSEDLPEKG